MVITSIPVLNPSSLTVSGTTANTGTISWTIPELPSNSIIESCILTGIATANMSKGTPSITVNNNAVTSNRQFTINLGTENTINNISVKVVGSNKNASGTVTFSDLNYTVTYSVQAVYYTVTFKDWDGSILKTDTVEEGNSATPPLDPSRDGYTFIGWDVDFSNIVSNISVIAQYKQNSVINIESITLSESEINLDVGMLKKITATLSPDDCSEKCVWSINNDNVSILVDDHAPENTLILYGQEISASLNNCQVEFQNNSFQLTSYSSSNASVSLELNSLNAGEIYTLSTDYTQGVVIEIYHGDTYTVGLTGNNIELTGYTSYTVVFYKDAGTTSNWGINNISFIDSSGNNNKQKYNGLNVTITGLKEGNTVLTCSNQDGTIKSVCNITIKFINSLDLGYKRGIFSWVYSDLIEGNKLARACNVLNITEIYQQMVITAMDQAELDELSDAIYNIKTLTKRNVEVIYLDGTATWYNSPGTIIGTINAVLNFNRNNKNNISITKIMLDIEPWSAGITGWYPVYQETMLDVYEHCKKYNLELALVVPSWLDNGIDPTIVTDFHKIVMDICDDYVCMNYNKNSYLTAMDVEMIYAKEKGKIIYSVAECQPVNETYGVSENLTYYNDGIDLLHQHWKNLSNKYGYDKLSFAYHDFNNAVKQWTDEVDITEELIESVSFAEEMITCNFESSDLDKIIIKLDYSWTPINADKDFTITVSDTSIASYDYMTGLLTITGNGNFTVTVISNQNPSIMDTVTVISSGFDSEDSIDEIIIKIGDIDIGKIYVGEDRIIKYYLRGQEVLI